MCKYIYIHMNINLHIQRHLTKRKAKNLKKIREGYTEGSGGNTGKEEI